MATIFGTSKANETIAGTNSEDVIWGGPSEFVYDNTGNDTVNAGEGSDGVYTGDGSDTLNGEGGNDDLQGGDGNDTLNGGNDDDLLRGQAGIDTLNGGDGNDVLVSEDQEGSDYIDGGAGSEDHLYIYRDSYLGDLFIDLSNVAVVQAVGDGTTVSNVEQLNFYSGTGDDILTGGSLNDAIAGGSGTDVLNGGAGDDYLTGGTGLDIVSGGDGNDEFDSYDADHIDGGSGLDLTYIYRDTYSGQLTLDLSDQSVQSQLGDGTTIVNVEQVIFSGGTGNDLLLGGDLDDVIDGGAGADLIEGGRGDDELQGNDGLDILRGGAGHDSLSDIDDDGGNVLSGGRGGDFVAAGGGGNSLWGGLGDDLLYGWTGADDLFGGYGADELSGQDGNDTLEGGEGDDALNGGAGSDRFVFGHFDGVDTVQDFENGQDKFDLTAVDVHSFGDITLEDTGSDILVDYGFGTFVVADVGDVSTIDATDFVFA